ncbi:MAG: TasA family protein [Aeromicrobium sp.]
MKTTKILLPLATLVAAGAIAVGSGATFTSTSANTISSVTSGSLSQSNTKANAAVFNLTNIKPGDVVNGSLTIKNTGTLPATFSLTETASTNTFTGANLTLAVTNTTTNKVVYTGTFGGLVDGTKNDLGLVEPGVSNDYTFSVKLDQATTSADQGKTASAAFQWDSIQASATTTNQ